MPPILHVDDLTRGESDVSADFALRLDAPATIRTTVTFATADITADSFSSRDYSALGTTTITLDAGETERIVSVPITDDGEVEPVQAFRLVFTSAEGLTLSRPDAFAFLQDNDLSDRAPVASVGDAAATEGLGGARFLLTLDRAAEVPVTVSWRTVADTAGPADFNADRGTATFRVGETAKTVTIPVADDGAAEPLERFFLELTGIEGVTGAELGDARGEALIGASDGRTARTPTLSVSDITVGEGTAEGWAAFDLRLDAPASEPVGVTYRTADGTADSFSSRDFSALGETAITFLPGETLRRVLVPITDDAEVEDRQDFFLLLSDPVGLSVATPRAVATIVDNDRTDRAPVASVGDADVEEGDGFATFDVTLDRAATVPVTVRWSTARDTAGKGDFDGGKGDVTFAPGETAKTVSVAIADDDAAEGPERFFLTLDGIRGVTGAALGDARGEAVIGASDGDPLDTPTLHVAPLAVSEGDPSGTARFVLRLDAPSGRAVSVDVRTADITADSFSSRDYTFMAAQTVTFAPGETLREIRVPLTDDGEVEPPQSFALVMENPVGIALARKRALATIHDNDETDRAPVVSISDTALDESEGFARFVLTLDRAPQQPLSVDWRTVEDSADGKDFSAGSGTVTFAPGDTAATLLVPVSDDGRAEGAERFRVELTGIDGITGAAIGDGEAEARIAASDLRPADTPTLRVADLVVGEGLAEGVAWFDLSLDAPSRTPVSVDVRTFDITADSFSSRDYSFLGKTTITFAPGETLQRVGVPITDDGAAEPPKSFGLALEDAVGLTLAGTRAVATIIDNDADDRAPVASVSDDTVNEVDGYATFTLSLDRAADRPVTVTYATRGIEAGAADFTGRAGTVTFEPGETVETLRIAIADDGREEGAERFALDLTAIAGVTGALIGDGEGIATIGTSDGRRIDTPLIRVDDIAVSEKTAEGTADFVLRLTEPARAPVRVDWATADVTADSFSSRDYSFVGATPVIFAPGETVQRVRVPITDDGETETPEAFRLTLSGVSGATLGNEFATATILSDDGGSVTLAAPTLAQEEGDRGTTRFDFTVRRTGTDPVSVDWSVTGEGADKADFGGRLPSGTVSFGPGVVEQTISVAVSADRQAEGDEAFRVTLSDPSDDLAILGGSLRAVILDDDSEGGGGDGGGDALVGTNKGEELVGTRADDEIFGRGGADRLLGGGGADTLDGGSGKDLLKGAKGADVLDGGGGRDRILGGGGADVIEGGGGRDRMTGNGGADVFLFAAAKDSRADRPDIVTDFDRRADVVDLSGLDGDPDARGDQPLTFVGRAGFSGTAGEARFDRLDSRLEVDLDGDAAADFAVLIGGTGGLTEDTLVL